MTMSVHDALQAWQAGEIDTPRTLSLTGMTTVAEMYALCSSCDVDIRRIEHDGSATRRALVNAVLKGMMDTEYDVPIGTMDTLRQWIADDMSVSLDEIREILRKFDQHKSQHPTERKVDRIFGPYEDD